MSACIKAGSAECQPLPGAAVFRYPNPASFNPCQQDYYAVVKEGFASFNVVSALTNVKMDEFTVEQSDWPSFVDELAELEESDRDKRRLLLWKRAVEYKSCAVDLFPDFDALTNDFSFKVRAFVASSGTVKFMEGVVKTRMRVHHREVNKGLLGRMGEFFTTTFGNASTSQQDRNEYERKLHAALADGTMLNAWIGENFVQFLSGAGIAVQPVDPSILAAETTAAV